jgi:hypothetical protein
MKHLGAIAALVSMGLSLISAPARAADPTSPAADALPAVIVRAPAPKRVHQLVQQFGEAFSGDRLSRWARPVCPLVLGLERDHAFYIEQRIDTIAKAAGVPVESGKCEPNLVVVVSEHATALRQSIARRGRGMLNSGSRWPIDKVQLRAFAMDDDAPAHVFYLNGESATFGGSALDVAGSSTLADVNGALSNFLFGPPVVSGFAPSRLIPKADDALQRVFVIIDGERVVGLTLQQIAAYVSMVALAEIRIDPPLQNVDTITAMFADKTAGKTPADDLTFWDRAYIGALYNSPSQTSLASQRSIMSQRIAHSIEVLTVPDADAANAPAAPSK